MKPVIAAFPGLNDPRNLEVMNALAPAMSNDYLPEQNRFPEYRRLMLYSYLVEIVTKLRDEAFESGKRAMKEALMAPQVPASPQPAPLAVDGARYEHSTAETKCGSDRSE